MDPPEPRRRQVVRGRTVVAIAHRLHTAHDADRVAVVEDGNITEIGTHHELVSANGAYAALWRSWRDEPEIPGPGLRSELLGITPKVAESASGLMGADPELVENAPDPA